MNSYSHAHRERERERVREKEKTQQFALMLQYINENLEKILFKRIL